MRSALGEYLKFQPEEYEIDADGHLFRLKAFIVAACNASQYGNNVFIAPMASIRDGLLDITLIHAGTPLTRARAGVELVTGMIKNNMIIQTLRVKKATIRRLSPGIAHVDGEPIRLGAEINVECNHGDLLIFTTGEKKPFRPLITPFQYLHREIRTWFRSVIGRWLRSSKDICRCFRLSYPHSDENALAGEDEGWFGYRLVITTWIKKKQAAFTSCLFYCESILSILYLILQNLTQMNLLAIFSFPSFPVWNNLEW